MTISVRRAIWLLAGIVAAANAHAGTNGADDASVFDLSLESLMELEVSVASPFESNVATTAASVTVLRPMDWERRGARSVEEALEQAPSVATYASLDSARMVALRGYANELSVRGMAVQLDGVPLNNFSYATSAYDLPFLPLGLLGGVEMIRGPGSTLYGSDAFHGVIALSTWRDTQPGAVVRLSGGSYGDAVLTARAGRQTGSGSLSAGFGSTHHGDRDIAYDYHDPGSGAPARGRRGYREDDRAAYLHLVRGERDDGAGRFHLNAYADRYEGRDFPGVGNQFYPPLARKMLLQSLSLAADRDLASQDSDFAMVSAGWERLFANDLQLSVDAYHWRAEQTWDFDFTAYPLTFPTTDSGVLPCRTALSDPNALPVFCPHHIYQSTRDRRTGLKVSLTREDRRSATQWVIGAGRDLMGVDFADVRRIGVSGQTYVNIETPFSQVERSIDFLQFQARTLLNERLSAVYGLRMDQYSDVGSATSPRVGLVYQGGPHWSTKLLYNQAFRAPSAAERFGSGPGSQQMANPDIRPETIRTVEWIWQYFQTGADTELSLYRSRWADGIVLNPVTQTVSQYQNTGRNEAWGAELGHSRMWRNWRVAGNLSYAYSRNVTTDSEYSAFPHWTANLAAGRELGTGWSVWLNFRAQLDRTDTDRLAKLPVSAAPDYARADLHLEHSCPRRKIWLDIRNLTDRDNITPSLYNAENGNPDEGRSLRLGGEWNW